MIGQHISHEYNEELEDIRRQVLEMGSLVEEQFSGASLALLKGEAEAAHRIARLDYQVNAMEVAIDEGCVQIIARRQPAATDLRMIFTAIKVITDLERIGDESEKIARFALELSTDTTVSTFYNNLKHLVRITQLMFNNALDCYAHLDAEKALEVSNMDSEIDSEFDNLNRLLITYMLEDIKNIENVLRVIWCARFVERVGDHAKNICEYIVYAVHGKDIRHTQDLEENEE